MTRLLSAKECDWHFYECLQADDTENVSSYYETLKLHYQNRGKRIKKLMKMLRESVKGGKQ